MNDQSLPQIASQVEALMDALGRQLLGRPLQDLGWRFRFDGARRRLGQCRWGGPSGKEISLSRFLAARDGWALMEDVARHEIAHAVDFETRGSSGHDRVWKQWAVRCGADPTRVYEGRLADDPSSRFVGRCVMPGCSYARPFYRAVTAAYLCATCHCQGRRAFLRIEERASGAVLRRGGETPGELRAARRPPYVGRCPACGVDRPFGRRPSRRYACSRCCAEHAGGRFDERFALRLLRRR